MRNDRNIAVVGVSDEDTAHLRLLIRKAGAQLNQHWTWGNESGADLVVVDPGIFAGQMARTRALASGLRCAVVANDALVDSDLVLRRPFQLASVVALLNLVGSGGGGATAAPQTIRRNDNFFFDDDPSPHSDSGEKPDLLTRMMEEQASQSPPLRFGEAAVGLDEVLKQDAAADRPMFKIPLNLSGDTLVEGSQGPTRRSEVRISDAPGSQSRTAAEPGPNTLPPVKRGATVDNTRHPFSAYLGNSLLRAPAQIDVGSGISLTLDPKNQTFYTTANLSQLEPCVGADLPRSGWRPVTTAELAQLRETVQSQPYSRLQWLNVLVHSAGRLSPALDPGGTYQLTQWLEIERDYRHHFRIATALMQPARLNEITASSGASMEDVFDVVNAYHAIGLIRCQPRASLRDNSGASAKTGLLDRLRKPFGKK